MTRPIEVLHESEHLLVVAKPAGLATVPEGEIELPSVRRALEAERGETLWVVHRLDKGVSGVLLFARDADAHRELCARFETRSVKKSYLALVVGSVPDESGTIDAPIREYGSGRMGVGLDGKASTTSYRVLRRGDARTLIEAESHTGRRHQIRVHLYSLGHPIVGDPRYGQEPGGATRLMLHAWKLFLPALSFASQLSFEAPPPRDFETELE